MWMRTIFPMSSLRMLPWKTAIAAVMIPTAIVTTATILTATANERMSF